MKAELKMVHPQTKVKKLTEQQSIYYENLYYEKLEDLNIPNYFEEEIPEIIDSKIEITIKQLKSEKTSGRDGTKNETIKHSVDIIKYPLRVVFNNILKTKIIPNQWNK